MSGRRVWSWVKNRYETPDHFFERFFIANYCPLMFLEASGRNRTPDKLPAREKHPLFELCDRSLTAVVRSLRPRFVIGIGKFAEQRARIALQGFEGTLGAVLHPSPASPLANRGWSEQAEKQLISLGIRL